MTNHKPSDRVVDLRAESDGVLESSARLREIETARRETDPADPRLRAINAEATRVATELVERTSAETGLAHDIADAAGEPETGTIRGTAPKGSETLDGGSK